jgi:ABC-type Zn uptake system ZnuABC Zn-binding protein ZnuA
MSLRSHPALIALLAGMIVTIGGCGKPPIWDDDRPGLKVMASFPPIYCFVVNVIGEHGQVLPLLDATGIHDYNPSPHDAVKLHKADLLFVNGLDLDDGFGKILVSNAGNPRLRLIDIGGALPRETLFKMEHKHDHAHGHGHAHGHAHTHGEFDPHIWLGIPEAIAMVKQVRDQLKKADPAHAADFDKNAEDYIQKLTELHKYGRKLFESKKERKIVTYHDSLRYFARGVGLEVFDCIQEVEGEDPSPARLTDLVKRCNGHGVRIIAVEPNQKTSTAATQLLSELRRTMKDAALIEVDILESVPAAELTRDYYEKKMKDNIDALAKELK